MSFSMGIVTDKISIAEASTKEKTQQSGLRKTKKGDSKNHGHSKDKRIKPQSLITDISD